MRRTNEKIFKSTNIFLAICIINSMTVLADTKSNFVPGNNETVLMSNESDSIVQSVQPRGLLISQAILGISNEGKGKIGVYSQLFAHVPVDRVYMKIYLDKYENETWVQQQYIELDFYQEDYPDDEMTMPDASFNLTGYPTGYYYRLRGMYLAEKYSTGQREVMSVSTNGVLITKPHNLPTPIKKRGCYAKPSSFSSSIHFHVSIPTLFIKIPYISLKPLPADQGRM